MSSDCDFPDTEYPPHLNKLGDSIEPHNSATAIGVYSPPRRSQPSEFNRILYMSTRILEYVLSNFLLSEVAYLQMLQKLVTMNIGGGMEGIIMLQRKSGMNGTLLSMREWQVIEYLSKGLSNAEIADKLGLSKSTVSLHIKRACNRLKAKTREQAVAMAIQQGFFDNTSAANGQDIHNVNLVPDDILRYKG